MRDILVPKKAGKVNGAHRRLCFDGEYTTLRNYKYNAKQYLICLHMSPSSYLLRSCVSSVSSTGDTSNRMSLITQFLPFLSRRRVVVWIQQFIQAYSRERAGTVLTLPNGSGHTNPARKRHLSAKNCPLAAKKPRN